MELMLSRLQFIEALLEDVPTSVPVGTPSSGGSMVPSGHMTRQKVLL